MTLSIYKIDEDLLYMMAQERGGYWEKSYNFYNSVKDKPVSELTEKQSSWLEKISDELEQI